MDIIDLITPGRIVCNCPVTSKKRVIEVFFEQRGIRRQPFHDVEQEGIEPLAVRSSLFPPIVALETAGVLNRPH